MKVESATRRANLWLFMGLVVFAIALCALILLWMRSRTHAQGGVVYPPTTSWQEKHAHNFQTASILFFCHPERSVTESKDPSIYDGFASCMTFDLEGESLVAWEVLRLRSCLAPLRMTEKEV